MPFEHSSVLIAVALDGMGRHLWLSCKGETLIKGVTLIGSFQNTSNWQKKENIPQKKKNRENAGIQSGFYLQKLKAFCRYTYLLLFQDGGNFKNFSKSQENAVMF